MEGLMLKLKLQYLGHLMQRADSLEKTVTRRQSHLGHRVLSKFKAAGGVQFLVVVGLTCSNQRPAATLCHVVGDTV